MLRNQHRLSYTNIVLSFVKLSNFDIDRFYLSYRRRLA